MKRNFKTKFFSLDLYRSGFKIVVQSLDVTNAVYLWAAVGQPFPHHTLTIQVPYPMEEAVQPNELLVHAPQSLT